MLGFVHDPPAVGDFRRIVRAANLIVEQLAPRVPHQAEQFRTTAEQLSGLIELLNPGRKRP